MRVSILSFFLILSSLVCFAEGPGVGFQVSTPSSVAVGKSRNKLLRKYVGKVRRKIIENWVIPSLHLKSEKIPVAKLVVRIDHEGIITKVAWEKKSGFSDYDDSCIKAIEETKKLPLPPEELKQEVYQEGFLIEFNPSLSTDLFSQEPTIKKDLCSEKLAKNKNTYLEMEDYPDVQYFTDL